MTSGTATGRRRNLRLLVVILAVVNLAVLALWGMARGGDGLEEAPTSPGAELVTFERVGGIAGARVHLTVTVGGTATLESDKTAGGPGWTRQLPEAEVDRLRSALDEARFETLEAEYAPPAPCSDCFVETISYRGRSVTVEDLARPAELSEVLALIGRLVHR